MAIDITSLKRWVGKSETVADDMAVFQARALAATLDREDAPAAGDALPPLWHWVYFADVFRNAALMENGHRRLGDFLPPIPLPRRMFGGARLSYRRPLRLGEPARCTTTIADVAVKAGRSGQMVVLTLRREFADAGGAALVEAQDAVYREAPRPGEKAPEPIAPPPGATWRHEVRFTEAILFRYSALLFNAYRIHYDRPYAESQGYAGLVVHGQLIATHLAELLRRHTDRAVASFEYRSVRPLVDTSSCRLRGLPDGDTVRLWAEDGEGALLVDARAKLA